MVRNPALWVLVDRSHAIDVLSLVGGERDGEIMSELERRLTAEVGKAFAFLFGHVIAIGFVRCCYGLDPFRRSCLLAPTAAIASRISL